jgi:hypothetical protein
MAKPVKDVKRDQRYPGLHQCGSKLVAPAKYTIHKSQISSTKLQINLKSQYSMTQTYAKIAACCDVKSGESGMMPLGEMTDGSIV